MKTLMNIFVITIAISSNCYAAAQVHSGIEFGSHNRVATVSAQVFWDSPTKTLGARFRCDKNDKSFERCDISVGPNLKLGKTKVSLKLGATTDNQWLIMPSIFKKTESGFKLFAVVNTKFSWDNARPDTIFSKFYFGKEWLHLRISHFSVDGATKHLRIGQEIRKNSLYFAPYYDITTDFFGAYIGFTF